MNYKHKKFEEHASIRRGEIKSQMWCCVNATLGRNGLKQYLREASRILNNSGTKWKIHSRKWILN